MSRKAVAYDFGVRPEAVNAWRSLTDALDRMADDGRRPICQMRPDQWFAQREHSRRDAAEACQFCPARAACEAFAVANDERFGVFGGRDFTRIPTKRKKAA